MTWVARSLKTARDLAINGRIEPMLISPRNAESPGTRSQKTAKCLFGPGLTQISTQPKSNIGHEGTKQFRTSTLILEDSELLKRRIDKHRRRCEVGPPS